MWHNSYSLYYPTLWELNVFDNIVDLHLPLKLIDKCTKHVLPIALPYLNNLTFITYECNLFMFNKWTNSQYTENIWHTYQSKKGVQLWYGLMFFKQNTRSIYIFPLNKCRFLKSVICIDCQPEGTIPPDHFRLFILNKISPVMYMMRPGTILWLHKNNIYTTLNCLKGPLIMTLSKSCLIFTYPFLNSDSFLLNWNRDMKFPGRNAVPQTYSQLQWN